MAEKEEVVEEEVVVEVPAETPEVETPPEPTVESIARDSGWSPKDEWRGPPEKWVSAADFLRAEKPIRDSLTKKVQSLEDKHNKLWSAHKATQEQNAVNMRKARENAIRETEARRKEALAKMDHDQFDVEDRRLRELERTPVPEAPQADNTLVEMEKQYAKDNTWYSNDKVMRAWAIQFAGTLRATDPDISPEDYFAGVTEAVKAQFPAKFRNDKREQPSTVEGGGRAAPKGKSSRDLPPEAVQAFHDDNRHSPGMWKDLNDYAQAYFREE